MKEPFFERDKSFLEINKWQQINPELRAGFTTRNGGASNAAFNTLNLGLHVGDENDAVVKNRLILAEKIKFPLTSWLSGEQTHGTNIKVVQAADRGLGSTSYETTIKDTDGFITRESDILCTTLFADCVPLFFFDPVTKYIGIAHAGWKGTVSKIAKHMVSRLTDLGVDKQNLLVAIGPCISQENYEVSDFIIKKINENMRTKVSKKLDENRYLLDLKQLNVEILLQSGILRNNIDVTTYCSFTNEDLFYSYRRDNGKTGRMLAYIGFIKRME